MQGALQVGSKETITCKRSEGGGVLDEDVETSQVAELSAKQRARGTSDHSSLFPCTLPEEMGSFEI